MILSYKTLKTAIFLWFFWVALTSSWSAFNLLLGAVCSLFVAVFAHRLLREQLVGRSWTLRTLLRMLFYAPALALEIVKANVDVASRVLSPSLPISPAIVKFKPHLADSVPRTVLANSITLTPGTLTVDIDEEGNYYIHCLADKHAEDLLAGGLEKSVIWIFEEEKVR
ncbi:MAG TPA: hypothetical protein DCW86_03425 [Actinobacteria bacterium]|nr:hypothetical protein [Actinomycetota bacterium]